MIQSSNSARAEGPLASVSFAVINLPRYVSTAFLPRTTVFLLLTCRNPSLIKLWSRPYKRLASVLRKLPKPLI